MSDHFVNDILPNKLGIKNQQELVDYEEKIVAEKIIALLKEGEAFEPDMEYFKHIHKVLFEDLYDFAETTSERKIHNISISFKNLHL